MLITSRVKMFTAIYFFVLFKFAANSTLFLFMLLKLNSMPLAYSFKGHLFTVNLRAKVSLGTAYSKNTQTYCKPVYRAAAFQQGTHLLSQ